MEAIQRAYQRLLTCSPLELDGEARTVAATIRKCCESRPADANQYFAPLLWPAFCLSLSSREPFEYEFSGDDRMAHSLKCSAAVLQKVGWNGLNVYARRWCKTVIQCLAPQGLSLRAATDLLMAKTYVAYLCEEMLPLRTRQAVMDETTASQCFVC